MLILPVFLGISVLFTAAAAVPLPNHHSTTVNVYARTILYRRTPQLRVGFRVSRAGPSVKTIDQDSTRALIHGHHEGPHASRRQKQAQSAYVKGGWRSCTDLDGNYLQTLKFTYHEGNAHDTETIDAPVTISRPHPLVPPMLQFSGQVPVDHLNDMSEAIYKDLPTVKPPRGCCVGLARVEKGWHTTIPTGIREVTKVEYHSGTTPSATNTIAKHTVYRPLTLVTKEVSKEEQPVVEAHVRQAYAEYGDDHPAKKANVAAVAHGWHDSEPVNGVKHKQVVVGYYDVPKDPRNVAGLKTFGDYPVALAEGHPLHY